MNVLRLDILRYNIDNYLYVFNNVIITVKEKDSEFMVTIKFKGTRDVNSHAQFKNFL